MIPSTPDYASRPVWYRRNRTRWLTLGSILVVAAALLWSLPLAWQRARILFWQRQCLHALSPSEPIFVSRTIDQARAAAGDPQHPGLYSFPSAPVLIPREFECRTNLKQAIATPNANPPEVPVFVHQRISPSGNVRLVVVNLSASEALRISEYSTALSVSLGFVPQVVAPATLCRDPVEVTAAKRSTGLGTLSYRRVRVFAGQRDPADPSRFTITYEVDDDRGCIEGRLLDNDTIELISLTVK